MLVVLEALTVPVPRVQPERSQSFGNIRTGELHHATAASGSPPFANSNSFLTWSLDVLPVLGSVLCFGVIARKREDIQGPGASSCQQEE